MPAPVIVIGAGPVGLTAAVELARRGTPVRVLDKLEQPTTESRAILVHARSLEMLERIGVVEEVRATGVRTNAMEMHAAGGTVARIDLGLVDSPFPYSVTLAQTETEQILTRALAAHGVTVERGVTLTGLEQDDSAVQVVLTRADGSEEHTSTPWLVGADGGHSTVRQLAGTALAGSFKGEKFLMGDVDAAHSLDPNTMYTFFSKNDGPLLAFPMRGDRIRLIAQIAPTEQGPATREWLQRVVDERADTSIQIKDARWLTLFDIHHAQVPQYRIGRVFLAGDAAHIHSPAGGQGMNTGMQDAFNLGWKLALAMEHGSAADSALLDSYHQERHPVGAAVVQFTTALTKVGTLSNPIAQTLRNHLAHALTSLGPVRTAMAEKTGETVVAYRDSPLVVPAAGRGRRLGGGDHLPAAGTALRAALAGESGHVLLTVAPQGAAPFAGGGPALRQILVGGGDPTGFDHVLDEAVEETAARYGLPEGGKIMIRPDGYIAAVAPLDDDAPLLAYQKLVRG